LIGFNWNWRRKISKVRKEVACGFFFLDISHSFINSFLNVSQLICIFNLFYVVLFSSLKCIFLSFYAIFGFFFFDISRSFINSFLNFSQFGCIFNLFYVVNTRISLICIMLSSSFFNKNSHALSVIFLKKGEIK
jgi:hypothetical protein